MALAPAVSPSAKMHSNLFGDSNGTATAADSFHLQMPNLESFFPMNASNQPPLFSVFQSRSTRSGATEKTAQQQTAYMASQQHHQQQQQQQQQNFSQNFQQTFASGPNVRGVQQMSKWAETRVTPGAVTSTRSATVSRFVEISSVNGSAQFSQWSTQSKTQTSSQGSGQSSQPVPALYKPDEFELPVVPLDLTAQLGKGNVGRKGSLGGRRPPSSRSRKNSPGPTPVSSESVGFVNATSPVMSATNVVTPVKTTTTTTTLSAEVVAADPTVTPRLAKSGKTPPPRPPPPVFRTPPTLVARGGQRGQGQEKTKAQDKETASLLHSIEQQEFPDTLKLFFVADSKSQTSRCDDAKSTSSTSSLPPPLPTSTPPTLPSLTDTLDMVFVERASPPGDRIVTDVVDIRDKESVENGEIVRRRTVITLGPKNSGVEESEENEPAWKRELKIRRSLRSSRENKASGVEPAESADIPVISGTINVTLKSANNSSGGYQSVKREGVSTMFVRAGDQEQRPARASAFNVRRTIEQRRNNANHQRANSPSSANQDSQLGGAPSQAGSVKSAYLFGQSPSLAGSSDLSIARTLSISMSLEDLDSSTESSSTHKRGPKKNEAWYERRQSYGFEAAEKFQHNKNKNDGNSDVFDSSSGRSTRLSRSCDSIDSHNKNGVTNFSELIPPWIRENRQLDENPPSVEAVPDLDPEPVIQPNYPTYVFGGGVNPEEPSPAVHPEVEPPQQNSIPLRRSESSSAKERPRSTANILDDDYEAKEPIWLRDLKMRRSLRESRHAGSESKTGSPVADPPWRNVKLRPTGLRLVSGELSPVRPTSEPLPETKTSIFSRPSTPGSTTSTDSRVLKLIERSRRNSRELLSVATSNPDAEVIRPSSPVIPKTEESDLSADRKLLHRKSIELMKLLDETPYVSPKPDEKPEERATEKLLEFDRESVFTRNSEVTDVPEESSAGTSLQASAEDLTHPTQRKTKKVGFAYGVKEESDQMIRPRRLRSKSPETRLKEWQAQREARNAAAHGDEAFTAYAKEANLPLMLFGDVNAEVPGNSSTPTGSTTSTQPVKPESEVSEVFRSLLQPRRPYSYPNSLPSVVPKETVTPPPPPPPAPLPEVKPAEDSFTSELAPPSPERKIVVVFEENGPPPKSILKKRSLENLLDDRSSAALETWSQRSVSSVTSSTVNHRPSYLFSTPTITSNQIPDESGSAHKSGGAPWKVNLKHVDPSQRVKSPDEGENLVTWKAELLRKKAASPQRVNCSSPADKILPEQTKVPSIFVSHCEISTDADPFKGRSLDLPKSLTVIEDLVKHDLGYHSLEVETGETKTVESVRLNRTSPLVKEQPVGEPQITKIRLRPVGRPKTPDYQEPVHVSPQKSLRKPLSPKMQHKNMAHINCTISSGSSPGKEMMMMTTPPVPGKRADGISRTNIMTSSAAEKDLHEQIERLTATFQEAQNHTSGTTGTEEDAATRNPNSSSNWRLSSRKAGVTTEEAEEVKKTLVELNPRVPSLGHPSASWRMTSSAENRVQVFEDEFLKTANQLASNSVFTSSSLSSNRRISPERNATPEPDFAEFKRSLEKLLSKTDSISEISAAESSDSIVIIESKRETRLSNSLNNSSGSTVEAKAMLRPNSLLSKAPERRKSHPLTKSESSPAMEHAPKQLTLGMPQDKATLLVRSFFSSSVIDSKRNRFSKTETIMEESSPATTPSLTPVTSKSDITLPNELTVTDLSYDSDDQFQLSGTELNSDFGSALDILNESVDAQDEFTMLKPCEYSGSSARSETSTIRAYSGSERSVRLSDILSQPSTTSSRRSTSVTSPVSSRGTPDRLSSSRIPLRVDSPSGTSATPSGAPQRSSASTSGKTHRPNSMTSSTDDVKMTSTKVIRRRNSKKSKLNEKPTVSKQTRKNSTDSSEPEDGRTLRTKKASSVQAKKREPSKFVPVRPTQQVPERPARKATVPADRTTTAAVSSRRTSTATTVKNPIGTSPAVRTSASSAATKRQSVVTASRSSRGSPAAHSTVTTASQEGHKTTRTSLLATGASSSSSTRTASSARVTSTTTAKSSAAKPRTTIQTQTKVSTQRVGIWV